MALLCRCVRHTKCYRWLLVRTRCATSWKRATAWNVQSPCSFRHMRIIPRSLFLEIGTKVSICLDQGLPEGFTGSLFTITRKLQLFLFSWFELPGFKLLGLFSFLAHPWNSEHISMLLKATNGAGIHVLRDWARIHYFVKDLT